MRAGTCRASVALLMLVALAGSVGAHGFPGTSTTNPQADEGIPEVETDQRSYRLGAIGAFAEMVGMGVKRLALSAPMTPQEMDVLLAEAERIVRDNGAKMHREEAFLVTDLFPEALTRDMHVLVICLDPAWADYQALKADKQALVDSGEYRGDARLQIARKMGRLLSYPDHRIEELLGSGAPVVGEQPEPVSFESSGSMIHAHLYEGAGGGRRPTVLLLPGFPSEQSPDILGLARPLALRGWSVLVIHYRGVGTNEGVFTADGALDDVKAAVDHLESAASPSVDPSRLAAIGHSIGGWTALLGAAGDTRIDCVGALTPANMGEWAREIAADPARRRYFVGLLEATTTGSPARGLGGEASVAEMLEHEAKFDLVAHAGKLHGRDVLVVGGWRDTGTPLETHVLPLVRALQASAPDDVTPVVLDVDHNFSDGREELHQVVFGWLDDVFRKTTVSP